MGSSHAPLKCPVIIPEPDQAPQDVISRWSDSYVELPALIVKPKSENDIIYAINYARENKLTLLTANGGRAPFVHVTSKTLYLDMKHFDQVDLNESSGTVRVGGGASTGDVIKSTTDKGYYTLWPNSNAVGYVGCLLGGGSDTMNGLHGYMVDAVESMQLITADGIKLEVSPSSEGREKKLFDALCGAGFGLAVITSVVMKAFPISSLGLTNNSIWTRRVMLPGTAADIAATTFASIKQLPPALHLTLICVRTPPEAPVPNVPMIMIIGSYFGPSDEGEMAASGLFDERLISRAMKAETELVPFADANLSLKPLSADGGYKGFSSTFLETADAETIQAAFDAWLQLGEKYEDARPTTLVFNKWDNKAISEHGLTEVGQRKFFEHRHQCMAAFVMRWCKSGMTTRAVDQFGDDFLRIMRRNETGPPRSIANSQRPGMNLEELFSKERLAELASVKSAWDPDRVFWSPY